MKGSYKIMLWAAGYGLVAVGCANYPISENLKEQAQPLTATDVTANPGSSAGQVVVWGGRVVKAATAPNGGALYIQELPLKDNEKPRENAASLGEFIAQGSVDTTAMSPGTVVTVAGKIAGKGTEWSQKSEAKYPVVQIAELHVWPAVNASGKNVDWGAGPYRGWETPSPNPVWHDLNSIR